MKLKLSELLKNLLLALFSRGIEPGEDDFAHVDDEIPADDGPVDPVDDETDDVQASDKEPQDDEPPAPRISRAQQTIIDSRKRAQEAERQLAAVKAELEAARRAPAQQPQPSQDELLWKEEEEVLRNPDAEPWQRYSVQSARDARAARASSMEAIRRSEDISDKAAFAAIATTKPKVYEKYKEPVEKMLGELRSKGANAPREKLLAILIGEDFLAGKIKSSASKPSSAAAPAPRGRSDVQSSGRRTEAEKRAERLKNVRI